MLTFVAIVHILFCLSLIALVLLQDPKNGGAGVFGGGGGANTLLGATGQTTFFAKMTRWSAVVFGVTCLTMTVLSRQDRGSVVDQLPVSAPVAPAPSAPAAPAQGAPAPNAPAPNAPAPNAAPGASAAPAAPSESAPAAPAQPKKD